MRWLKGPPSAIVKHIQGNASEAVHKLTQGQACRALPWRAGMRTSAGRLGTAFKASQPVQSNEELEVYPSL